MIKHDQCHIVQGFKEPCEVRGHFEDESYEDQ